MPEEEATIKVVIAGLICGFVMAWKSLPVFEYSASILP
jgi:hypothetical protein